MEIVLANKNCETFLPGLSSEELLLFQDFPPRIVFLALMASWALLSPRKSLLGEKCSWDNAPRGEWLLGWQ
jgi:hypothetical protein